MRKSSALTGACLGVCLTLVRPCGSEEEKKPAPVYTNEDLDRVAPFRDETGVNSKPAARLTDPAGVPAESASRRGDAASDKRRSAEEYWRREADRVRGRLQPARDRAAELRLKIEERRRQPGVRPYTDPRILADQRRLEGLEQRIREAESRFEDRARRQGALPGWLR